MRDKETPFWHEKLHVYQRSLTFISRVELLIKSAPGPVGVLDHLGRASESIAEQIVNGNAQWSSDLKCRFLDIARGSALECAACMDLCLIKQLVNRETWQLEKGELQSIVKMIAGLIRSKKFEMHESQAEYISEGGFFFDHEKLEVYQSALRFAKWVNPVINDVREDAIRRKKLDESTTSIVLNIAEGNGRSKAADHRNFVDIAHRSALKAALQLDLIWAKDRLAFERLEEGKDLLGGIVRMLLGLRIVLHNRVEEKAGG